MNDSELKNLLQPFRAKPSEAFVHGVMRRVQEKASAVSAWTWPRWVMPTLAFSAMSFFVALSYTLMPESVSAETLLSVSIEKEIGEWLGMVEP